MEKSTRLIPVSVGRDRRSHLWGLYAEGKIVWPLQENDICHFQADHDSLHDYCRRRGFRWDGAGMVWGIPPTIY